MSQALLASVATAPHPANWPIGREDEIAAARRLVAAGTRLVTLTGPGGVGKTCLALALAADLQEDFAGQVSFTDLSSVRDPAQVAPAIAATLRLATSGLVALDWLAASLDGRRLLLILDNLEQITGADDLVSTLLRRTHGPVILVTSRTRLEVPGETAVSVLPLPTRTGRPAGAIAASHAPAVRLFHERARSAWPAFTVTAENGAAIEAICQRLDGLPLAIELAAARIVVLTPAAMLARIEQQRSLLARGNRDLPDRHRSLRAAIEWSYDLLTEPERRRFRRLAVFAGSFDRDAAIVMLLDGAGGENDQTASRGQRSRQAGRWLAALERQSLLVRQDGPRRADRRWVMLQTIRTHARSLLDEDPERADIEQRHLDWCVSLATGAERALNGPGAARSLDRLDRELANLRHALRYATNSGRAGEGLLLAVALWRYWETRGLPREGVDTLERLLGMDDANDVDPRLRGTAINHLANLLTDIGEFHRAAGLYEDSLSIRREAGEPGPIADTLNNLGLVAAAQGDIGLARQRFDEALVIRRREGDRWGEALALGNLGDVAAAAGDAELAIPLHEDALAIRRAIGDQRGIAFATSNLAEAYRLLGDHDRAGRLLTDASRRFERLGIPFGEALVQRNRGDLARDAGDVDAAVDLWRDALRHVFALGDRGQYAGLLERIAAALIRDGADRDGVVLLGAADRLREETGIGRSPVDDPGVDAALASARAQSGDAVLESAWSVGRAATMASVLEIIGTASNGDGTDSPETTSLSVDRAPGLADGLTDRERQVVTLLSEGLSNAGIAERLYISSYTVNAHLRRIYRHFGVTTRTAAVRRFLRGDGQSR